MIFLFFSVRTERSAAAAASFCPLPRGGTPAHQPDPRRDRDPVQDLPTLSHGFHRPPLVREDEAEAQGAARQAPLHADRVGRARGAL
jgi:hypothetical protein